LLVACCSATHRIAKKRYRRPNADTEGPDTVRVAAEHDIPAISDNGATPNKIKMGNLPIASPTPSEKEPNFLDAHKDKLMAAAGGTASWTGWQLYKLGNEANAGEGLMKLLKNIGLPEAAAEETVNVAKVLALGQKLANIHLRDSIDRLAFCRGQPPLKAAPPSHQVAAVRRPLRVLP
jgi:hypothetical protein